MSGLIQKSAARLSKMKRGALGLMVLILYLCVWKPLNVLLCAALVVAWLLAKRRPATGTSQDGKRPSFIFVEKDSPDIVEWFEKTGFDEVYAVQQRCEKRGRQNCVLSREMVLPAKGHWRQINAILKEYGIISDIADGEFYIAWGHVNADGRTGL